MSKTGKIHLYFGYGKGKTTAAMGLCLRAAGAGKRVLIYQFLKDNTSNERNVLKTISNLTCLEGLSHEKFIWDMTEEEKKDKNIFYKKKLEQIRQMEPEYDVIFLDELLDTVSYGILEEEVLLQYMKEKADQTELIITGHEKHEKVIDLADYVTEMKKIKHPFDEGCTEREGIEH